MKYYPVIYSKVNSSIHWIFIFDIYQKVNKKSKDVEKEKK